MTKFHEDWFSQAGQDKWVCDFFDNKTDGYFLDIGAGDGIGDNNTYHLEKKLNWTGVCIECGIQDYLKCRSLRKKSIVLPIAVWSEETNLSFDIRSHTVKNSGFGMPAKALTLKTIFEKYDVPMIIDYVSLDIEGSELEALKGWPWETHKSILFTVEHNLYLKNDSTLKTKLFEFLSLRGYIRAVENVTCEDSKDGPFEDWYVHKDYLKS